MTKNDKPAIYLAGPITAVDDSKRSTWRNQLKEKFSDRFEFHDPMEHRFDGSAPEERARQVAHKEREQILHSDAVLANLCSQSMGTAIGMMYGYMTHRIVVGVVNPLDGFPPSPLVRYHLHAIEHSFESALQRISTLLHRRSPQSVEGRDGCLEPFSIDRLERSIARAREERVTLFEQNLPPPSKLAQAVMNQLEEEISECRLPRIGIKARHLQDVVEMVLVHNAHRPEVLKLAQIFIRNRAIQDDERKAKARDQQTLQFVEREILHTLKGKVGNINRDFNDCMDALEANVLADAREYLSSMAQNITAMKDVLADARNRLEERYDEVTISPAVLVSSLQTQYAKRCQFDVQISFAKFVWSVPFKLKSIFENIINNAIQHGFLGRRDGVVTIRFSEEPGGGARGYISNDGPPLGLQASGTENWGIGRKHVEELGAELGIQVAFNPNSPEGGPAYTLLFPVSKIADENVRKLILVADDDDADRSAVAKRLVRAGFDVVEANSPDSALQLADRIPHIYGVVLDVDFKCDTDGLALLRELRQYPKMKHVRAVIVSSSGMPQWRDRAEQVGATPLDKGMYSTKQLVACFTEN